MNIDLRLQKAAQGGYDRLLARHGTYVGTVRALCPAIGIGLTMALLPAVDLLQGKMTAERAIANLVVLILIGSLVWAVMIRQALQDRRTQQFGQCAQLEIEALLNRHYGFGTRLGVLLIWIGCLYFVCDNALQSFVVVLPGMIGVIAWTYACGVSVPAEGGDAVEEKSSLLGARA